MCYSAIVEQNSKSFAVKFKARVQIDLYNDLFERRAKGEKLTINKGMEHPFIKDPQGDIEQSIALHIRLWRENQTRVFEEDLFRQKTRLNEALKKLETKPTKAAEESKRIATDKIEKAQRKIKSINSPDLLESDARIFPFHYMSMLSLDENGEKVVAPVRYHMRPHSENETFDKEKDGCYNARLDNLKRVPFWKDSLEKRRGLILVKKFFENVSIEKYLKNNKLPAGQPEKGNIVLCFDPNQPDYMILPTVWDYWPENGTPSLRSAALITDDPHPEVAAAGHDRTPITLKPSAAEDWLRANCIEDALTILKQEREQPYFSHQVLGAA